MIKLIDGLLVEKLFLDALGKLILKMLYLQGKRFRLGRLLYKLLTIIYYENNNSNILI